MRELDIGEVVRRSGVPASTLRYYEQLGLVQVLGRRGLRRQYDQQVLERLALIGLGQSAGLSLQQIGAAMPQGAGLALDRTALLAQADALQQQIRGLQRVQDRLRRAAACPHAEDARRCASFRRLLSAQQRVARA
ncbi:MerR family transcriptional regulator [Stenotrophomonas sp. LMG 10879]|uniref:MerR family transcriptional regulator n=1 Tax=Stenotrophomonas sp. LMG 10879 TaxID=487706 RepID=UPI000C1A38B1|nr:MerR family transcriptional regulator [Stenotrophomonas sp. LMG 10879]PII21880.1 MerR family transcriptional regulator [Stenotrophomonas sp. LMG 10879]